MGMLNIAKEKVDCLCAGLFIIGLAVISYFDYARMWEGITIAFGVAIVVRQFLLGRMLDLFVSIIVFGGIFIAAYWQIAADAIVPLLLGVGSLYFIIMQIIGYRRECGHRKGSRCSNNGSEEPQGLPTFEPSDESYPSDQE